MATNDFGFSSALASFENAYSNKASRDYTKQQTKGLADENQRKDIQNVSNTVLGQDAFGVKDGALVADVPKVMNLSDGAFENEEERFLRSFLPLNDVTYLLQYILKKRNL